MTEHQRLFLVQARSDFAVFKLLREHPDLQALPACHALHYLQMATEKLGKAHLWKHGCPKQSHQAFVSFLNGIKTDRSAQSRLGYKGQNENWKHTIRKSIPLARRIEILAPAESPDGPNPEYPWPRDLPEFTPAEHTFVVWQDLNGPDGRQLLHFVTHLFEKADEFL